MIFPQYHGEYLVTRTEYRGSTRAGAISGALHAMRDTVGRAEVGFEVVWGRVRRRLIER